MKKRFMCLLYLKLSAKNISYIIGREAIKTLYCNLLVSRNNLKSTVSEVNEVNSITIIKM